MVALSYLTTKASFTHRARFFEEQLLRVDFDDQLRPVKGNISKIPNLEESVYQALVTGVRDYVQKNGFPGVVVGPFRGDRFCANARNRC